MATPKARAYKSASQQPHFILALSQIVIFLFLFVDDIVAVSKPYGLAMFGKDSEHSVEKYLDPLTEFLKCQSLHQVHRLDKITSGILLLAKTKESHLYLTEKFRKREIQKSYWTIVNGTPQPSEGRINIPLCEAMVGDRFRITLRPGNKGHKSKLKKASVSMPAVTEYATLSSRGNRALLDVSPVTGFKHQIRVHLGLGLGCPVLGDHKYSSISFDGKPQKVHGDILERLGVRESRSRDLPTLLHAKRVIIPHPEVDGKNIIIESKLPFYFNRIMKALLLLPKAYRVQDIRRG